MYYDEDSDYDYFMDDVYKETADRIKFLSDFDLKLLTDFVWKEETYENVTKLVKNENWSSKDLIALSFDEKQKLSKIFQNDELLLDQFSAKIEKEKIKEIEDVDFDYDYF